MTTTRRQKGPKRFTVEGPGPFPIDMLRYDSCWPFSSADAIRIEASHRRNAPTHGPFRVTLETNAEHAPTDGRWSSFGYTVLP